MVPLFLVVFLSVFSSTKLSLLPPKYEDLKPHLMKSVLQSYEQFQTVFHVDNHFLDHFEPIRTSVVIYNHFLKSKFERPTREKIAHFVALQNVTSFWKYLRYDQNVMDKDVVIFFVDSFTTFSDQFLRDLDRAGDAVMVTFATLEVYRVCFFCRQHHEFLVRINSTNFQGLSFPKKERNYHRYEMKIAYLDYYPFVFCPTKQTNGTCENMAGVEVEAIKLLSQRLNFTCKFHKYEGDYTGLFENVAAGKFDLAIGGLLMTAQRYDIIQFSYAWAIEDVVAVYTIGDSFPSVFFVMFLPFSLWMWFGIFLVLLGTAVFIFIIHKTDMKLKTIFQNFLKIALEQPVNFGFVPKKNTFLVVLSSWLLFSFLVTTAYKSRLVSVLIHPSPQHVPTLDELIDDGYGVVVLSRDVFIDSFNSEQLRKLTSSGRLIETSDFCHSIKYIKHHKSIAIRSFTFAFFHSEYVCDQDNKISSVTTPDRAILTGKILYGLPFRFGIPFFSTIDKKLNSMIMRGFMSIWKEKFLWAKNGGYRNFKSFQTAKKYSINSKTYHPHFVLYITGILLSFVVFLGECFRAKIKIRN